MGETIRGGQRTSRTVQTITEAAVNADGVVGFDEGGVFNVNPNVNDVLVTAPSKDAPAPKDEPTVIVFTNTRYPDQKIARARGEGSERRKHGKWYSFASTKLTVNSEEEAEDIEALNKPFIFREPAEFTQLDPASDKFFRHPATGFKTLRKDAYEDWVNKSEWSVTAR